MGFRKCSEEKERFCARMALNGNVKLLQHLHENGCPWDEVTCRVAAEYGHLECLKYALKTVVVGINGLVLMRPKWSLRVFRPSRCPWDMDLF